MTANELRIGNWVLHTNGNGDFTFEIEEILAKGINVVHNGGIWFIKYEYIEPITITPEILEKCGFVKEHRKIDIFSKGRLRLWFGVRRETLCYLIEEDTATGHYIPNPITSVHQLQNLYWCLCGKELEVNLT